MFYFDEDHIEDEFEEVEEEEKKKERREKLELFASYPKCITAEHKSNSEERNFEGKYYHFGGVDLEFGSPLSAQPTQCNHWLCAENMGSSSAVKLSEQNCNLRTMDPALNVIKQQEMERYHNAANREEFLYGEGDDFFNNSDVTFDAVDNTVQLATYGVNTVNYSYLIKRKRSLIFSDFFSLTDDHLGTGAYASVRTCVSLLSGKEFAVKLVNKHEAGHTRSRIMREVETFKLCKNHPNIVQLQEWYEDDDYFYMVFEKMKGGPLLNHIQRKGFFTEQEASKVTKDIANALKFLHDRGIAHRDVKPENVLCSDEEHVSPVKICDLDLASKAGAAFPPKLPSMNSEPDLASPVGSAEFMAPEVVDTFVGDALKYDKRCDMWSLGVIVYIMICGYPPFYGSCWRSNCGWDEGEACCDCQDDLFKRIQQGKFDFPDPEWENVSEEAKDLICHLLVKNVRDRFTADEVLKHPWISNGAPDTKLQTPGNLFRNDSTRDVHQMHENFNAMNRFVAARLSSQMETITLDVHSNVGTHRICTAKIDIDGEKKSESKEPVITRSRPQEQNNFDGMISSHNKLILNGKSALSSDIPQVAQNGSVFNNFQNSIFICPQRQCPPVVNPLHNSIPISAQVPQIALVNQMNHGGFPMAPQSIHHHPPIPLPPQQSIPYHTNTVLQMNGALYYPNNFVNQVIYPSHVFTERPMLNGYPGQFVMAIPDQVNNDFNSEACVLGSPPPRFMKSRASIPSKNIKVSANRAVNNACLQKVRSSSQLELETCQTAMAKQDSKSDLCQAARETQVNV